MPVGVAVVLPFNLVHIWSSTQISQGNC